MHENFNNPSILGNNSHVDFLDKNLNDVRFIKSNSYPAKGEHAAAKKYVDQGFDEPTLIRKNDVINFNNISSTTISHITSISEPFEHNHATNEATKAHFDSSSENDRNRLDLAILMNDQDSDFCEIKIKNLNFYLVNRNPTSDVELSNKIYIDDRLKEHTFLRFNATLEKFLKVNAGETVYNIRKN